MEFVISAVRRFFLKSTVHGLRFISTPKLHWSERIIWLLCCVSAWYGSMSLILASWSKFQYSAISFAVETTYIEWNTNFPAVHVCEIDNGENLRMDGITSYDILAVYKEITYFRGQAFFLKTSCVWDNGTIDPACPQENYYDIALKFRKSCEDLLVNCSWNEIPFECCNEFRPLQTEVGLCYSINSLQTERKPRVPALSFTSNVSTGPGKLTFEIKVPSELFWTSRDAVPLLAGDDSRSQKLPLGRGLVRLVALREVVNARGVREVARALRRCRFHDEVMACAALRVHSAQGCVSACRRDAQRRVCGCVSHQAPGAARGEMCGLDGLLCLHKHYLQLSVLGGSGSDKLVCACPVSCQAEELRFVYEDRFELAANASSSLVETRLAQLPTERFKRYVVCGALDFVVSMGGSVGLFVGASLLSFTELLHHFSLRLWVDWRRRPRPRPATPPSSRPPSFALG